MNDIIMDTLMDGLKLIPFLFIAFLIIEVLEHKMNKKNKKMISDSGKVGPLIGGILGVFPQCGFSVLATNLYVTRIITLGTLIAVYLSTSDEMLPILLSENVPISTIIEILGLKLCLGIFYGFIIDFIFRKKIRDEKPDYDICEEEHCHCKKDGIFKSAIFHTINILMFIMIISFLLNLGMEYLGEEVLSKIFMKDSFFGPFIASLIGLIPNCGASVMLTELYIHGAINLGSSLAGLLTSSGVGILVLFKQNKNMKENLMILGIIYGLGVISGIVIELIGLL